MTDNLGYLICKIDRLFLTLYGIFKFFKSISSDFFRQIENVAKVFFMEHLFKAHSTFFYDFFPSLHLEMNPW